MYKQVIIFTLLAVFLNPLSANATSAGELLALTCSSCHGTKGVSHGPATPSIAGLSKNYIIASMLSYKHIDNLDHAQDIVDERKNLDDVVILKRSATIMTRIAKAYSIEEIEKLADYFSSQKITLAVQDSDKDQAKKGEKLHDRYCEKCHEEGGIKPDDDVGLLAGQWQDYLRNSMHDFRNSDREMPKKMRNKIDKMVKKKGANSIEALIQYYASQK